MSITTTFKLSSKVLLVAASITAIFSSVPAGAYTKIAPPSGWVPEQLTYPLVNGSTYTAVTPPTMYGDYPITGHIDSHLVMVKAGWQLPPNFTTSQDMPRYYFVYVPASYKPGTKAPLVIVMHGGGLDFTDVLKPACHRPDCITANGNNESSGYGASVWATSSMDYGNTWASVNPSEAPSTPVPPTFDPSKMAQSVADKYGVLVAVPNGTYTSATGASTAGRNTVPFGSVANNYWNDCSKNELGPTDSSGNLIARIDDVGFISQMIQKMQRPTTQTDAYGSPGDGYSVDTSRIYVTGASNGGDMAHRLARELSGIAAAGFSLGSDGATQYTGVGHPIQLNDQCSNVTDQTASPVPIWMFKGQQDHAVPYYGGQSYMNFSSWYVPYEPYPAGYPGQSNALRNFNTSPGDLTFLKQTLSRYKLYNTAASTPVSPVSSYVLKTNPRPTDTVLWTGHTSNDDGAVPAPNGSPTDSVTNCDVYINTSLSTSTAANPRAQVTNCSASNAGHIEASWAAPSDTGTMWTVGPQGLDFDTTSEYWKFFQHWTLTTYKP